MSRGPQPFQIRSDHWGWEDDNSTSARRGRVIKRLVEIVGAPYLQRMQLDSQLPCRELNFFPIEYRTWVLWIPEHRHTRELGNHFPEQIQPFSSQLRTHLGQPCNVAAGPRQALNQPTGNRVIVTRHNDRDCPGSFFGSQRSGTSGSDDDINLETDEIGCEVREAITTTLRIAVLDGDVLALDPSEVAEPLTECLV